MRQVTLMVSLISILVIISQCSRQESINNYAGRTEVALAPDTIPYYLNPEQTDSLTIYMDTLRWVYEFPTGGPSGLSLILAGWSQLDLEVETYLDDAVAVVPLVRDSTGAFSDTIPLVVTPPSEEMLTDLSAVMLTRSSRLFVKKGEEVLDIIPLENPW